VTYNQRAAKAHGAKLSTINDFFFQAGKNRIELDKTKMDANKENQNALAAIQRKVSLERILHQDKMANIQIDQMKDKAAEKLVSSMVSQTMGNLKTAMSFGQGINNQAELNKFFGIDNPSPVIDRRTYDSIYNTGRERLA